MQLQTVHPIFLLVIAYPFFNTGRVLNRFARDIGFMDSQIPAAHSEVLIVCMALSL